MPELAPQVLTHVFNFLGQKRSQSIKIIIFMGADHGTRMLHCFMYT